MEIPICQICGRTKLITGWDTPSKTVKSLIKYDILTKRYVLCPDCKHYLHRSER